MEGLIFDFDGLIVDTESAIYEAWRELYESQGHPLLLPKYVQCVGSTFSHYDPMAELEKLCGSDVDWDLLLPIKDATIRERQSHLDVMPGIQTLLTEATGDGISCAIASSSQRSHVMGWLNRMGLQDSFHAILTRDDVARAKPWPDLFLAAAAALQIQPSDGLILEDSSNGLRAAIAAGTPCVVVPSPVTKGSDFTGAAAVLHTLADVTLATLRAIHRTVISV